MVLWKMEYLSKVNFAELVSVIVKKIISIFWVNTTVKIINLFRRDLDFHKNKFMKLEDNFI